MLAALAALVALALCGQTQAFWIISHHPLTAERLDPIVSGSSPAGHVHNFVGDADILGNAQNTTCTTSEVKDDRSRYWAPQLYSYATSTGFFEAVPLDFVNTYYLNRGDNLTAFPYGLRMIAGNAKNYDAPLTDPTAAMAISFVCLGGTSGQTTTMPAGPCPSGLRTQMIFPSCWDGVNLDSPDHQSHMSYPTGGYPDNGPCPASHPVKFMTLFYEFIWSTGNYVSNSTNTLVLANGDAVGYSFHADFISGWNETTLQSAVNQCTGSLFGDLQGCPPFVPSYEEEVEGTSYCTAAPILNENVVGPLASMPGCNYIHNGPLAGAGKSDPACGGNGTATPALPATYRGCYQDPANGRALINQVSMPNGNSAEACQAACTAAGYSVAGTQYSSQCFCGNSLSSGSIQVSNAECNMICSGNSLEVCGGPNLNSVYSASNVTIAQPPSQPATIGNYTWQGCITDSSSRILSASSPSLGKLNTLDACAAACSNYKYFGTEYSDECYCANQLNAGYILEPASQCNMLCSGNVSQYCGAGNRLSLYALPAANATSSSSSSSTVSTSTAPVASAASTSAAAVTTPASTTSAASSSSAASTTTSSTPASAAVPSGFSSLGCYADNTGARTLTTLAYSNSQNTPAKCTAACRASGYRYAGTEYGAECYCNNQILNAGTSGTGQTGCTMACAGDSTQQCGGPNRLNIYEDLSWKQSLFTVKSSGQWNFTDCFVDPVNPRALNVTLAVTGSSMTVESCLKACSAKNLKLCGMEYSGECYGTQSASTSGLQSAPVPNNGAGSDPIARGCSMPCNGNKSETCGGPARLNVFTLVPTWSASSPTTFM